MYIIQFKVSCVVTTSTEISSRSSLKSGNCSKAIRPNEGEQNNTIIEKRVWGA
jgi:hypothetical protein